MMARSTSRSLRPYDRLRGITRLVRELNPYAIDVLFALVLTAIAIAIVSARPGGHAEFRDNDVLGTALVLMQTLPLALRRVAPLGVLAPISAGLVAHAAIGYEVVEAGTFSSLFAVYGAAALTDSRGGIITALVTAAAIALFFTTSRGDWDLSNVAGTSGTWAVAWFAGTFVRIRGEQADVAGARAALLELERDARAREAVADERARMARELHDIVGHALNVIVIQAAGARRVFDARPEVPREALASIESAGRDALFDMERMLGVLRASNAEDDASGPQPGLAQLDGLVAHVAEAGMPVEVVVEGDRREIPASVDLSAYRIVQEALTNCLKHSGGSQASVTIRYRPDGIEVEVVDNGRGLTDAGEGNQNGGRGHLGMRERVALFGGEISIGAMPAGDGYRVSARLPFKSTPA